MEEGNKLEKLERKVEDLERKLQEVTDKKSLLEQVKDVFADFAGKIRILSGNIQSGNFKSGEAGWSLNGNGDLEANDGTFRGRLEAEEGYFNGDIEGATFIGTNFEGINVDASNITGTNITGGDISGTNIDGVDITGSTVTGSTIRTSPDGTLPRIVMDKDTHKIQFWGTDITYPDLELYTGGINFSLNGVEIGMEAPGLLGFYFSAGDVGRMYMQSGSNITLSTMAQPIEIAENLILSDLPTSDPANAGEVWNDAGTLKISSG